MAINGACLAFALTDPDGVAGVAGLVLLWQGAKRVQRTCRIAMSKSLTEEYLSLDDQALVSQCDVDHYRARGPGGQKRNKTSSAVRLRHRPTGLAVTATEDRSQHVNRRHAIRRLRAAIALGIRTPVDLKHCTPSELLLSCIVRDGPLRVGRRDLRYYPVVSEVLDILSACDARVRETAKCMGVSTASLVHFFRKDPKLWERVGRMRLNAGIKPLR